MPFFFYGLVAAASFIALQNWRGGLYGCLLLEVLRDPIRKLDDRHSVWVTASVVIVWMAVFAGVVNQDRRRLDLAKKTIPELWRAVRFLVLALVPGAMFSVASYSGGWKLAMLGAASYVGPILGITIGLALSSHSVDVWRVLVLYCVVNSLALVGTPLEYLGWGLPMLGGIDVTWVRYQYGYTVDLIAGFYRSPDVMGLHAATVMMIGVVLGTRQRGPLRAVWWSTVLWSCTCLLVSGRRKMIAMPFVFAAVLMLIQLMRGKGGQKKVVLLMFASVTASVVFFAAEELYLPGEYNTYARTLLTEGVTRTSDIIIGSTSSTYYQSGFFGGGLGTATQGRYHFGAVQVKGWQEDGVSRLLAELGVLGCVILAFSLWQVLGTCRWALRSSKCYARDRWLQLCLFSVVVANGASFLVSHQVYSGDPCSTSLVAMCLGAAVGLSCRGVRSTARLRNQALGQLDNRPRGVVVEGVG